MTEQTNSTKKCGHCYLISCSFVKSDAPPVAIFFGRVLYPMGGSGVKLSHEFFCNSFNLVHREIPSLRLRPKRGVRRNANTMRQDRLRRVRYQGEIAVGALLRARLGNGG